MPLTIQLPTGQIIDARIYSTLFADLLQKHLHRQDRRMDLSTHFSRLIGPPSYLRFATPPLQRTISLIQSTPPFPEFANLPEGALNSFVEGVMKIVECESKFIKIEAVNPSIPMHRHTPLPSEENNPAHPCPQSSSAVPANERSESDPSKKRFAPIADPETAEEAPPSKYARPSAPTPDDLAASEQHPARP